MAIARYLADPKSVTEASRAPRHAYQWLGWAMAAVLATIAIAGWLRPRPAAPDVTSADLAFTIAPTAGSLTPVGDLHATPQISPDGSAVIFYRDIAAALRGGGVQVQRLKRSRRNPYAQAVTETPDSGPRIRGRSSSATDQPEEDACAGRRAGTRRQRDCHDGGRELERQRHPADYCSRCKGPGLYAVPAAGGDPKRIDVTGRGRRTAGSGGRSSCPTATISCSWLQVGNGRGG